jgi:hypothetical protein
MAVKQSARQGRILVRTELRIAGSMDMHNNKTISRYPSGKSVFRSVIRNIDSRRGTVQQKTSNSFGGRKGGTSSIKPPPHRPSLPTPRRQSRWSSGRRCSGTKHP